MKFSYSHVLTILIGFFKIALIFIVFYTTRNNHDIIIYAILIFIYLEVHDNGIRSLWDTNNILKNVINIRNNAQGSSAFEQSSWLENLHGAISYVFVTIMRLICLYYFLIAVLYEDY